MALVPETKEMKEQAEMERCVAWVASRPDPAERARFCEHGRYWGFNGALRFMSPCCKTAA